MATPPKSELAGTDTLDRQNTSKKLEQLEQFRSDATGQALRTNHGVKIADNQNSLRAGTRGPSLLEDFIMREKITHFDHERIPERIVHARGTGAYGYFQPYQDWSDLTKAALFRDPNHQTPVFVRFSTVQGPRGSGDTVRDVRGFAIKFYTEEGNWDMVGNNMPVFFIQDAIKFPDFVHAVKPEPHNEIPTGGSAHDTFWDFVSLVPESAHMVLWTMTDRAIPVNLRSMQGFGIHTFRMINTAGKGVFVKIHLKPAGGVRSLVWDEAQKLAGKDTDAHRRDLWEAIEAGDYPEWEFGVQIIPEEDEHKFDWDILDATKIIPEELVPITPLGKLVLNRNPDNYFAETEQVAFCPGHVVPGIDFSNDPLLQGRLFSYTDTQISRLGGPNFHELPVNRPVVPNHNGQRDAKYRMTIDKGRASYEPNSIDGGWPKETPPAPQDGGYESYYERIDGHKVRERSETFGDHFSQATLFYNSLSEAEQAHVADAYSFELGKVERMWIRERQVNEILANIDLELAQKVAKKIGVTPPTAPTVPPRKVSIDKSPALSQLNLLSGNIKGFKVAVLVGDGVIASEVEAIKQALKAEGAHVKVLGPTAGPVKAADGSEVAVDGSAEGMPSVALDAVYVPGGAESVKAMLDDGVIKHYLLEAYKHLKAIALTGEAEQLLKAVYLDTDEALLTGSDFKAVQQDFFAAIAKHRCWARMPKIKSIPA